MVIWCWAGAPLVLPKSCFGLFFSSNHYYKDVTNVTMLSLLRNHRNVSVNMRDNIIIRVYRF